MLKLVPKRHIINQISESIFGDFSGILLDNYQISHYTETLFPRSKFKIDEVLKEETLSYGAMVNDSFLAQCFSKLIAEDKYLIYDFTKKELNKTLKVILQYLRRLHRVFS